MTAKRFQSKLKKFLKDYKKTQRWLAKRLDVPETTMSRWILGSSAPKKDKRESILSLVEVLEGMPLHHEPEATRNTKKQTATSSPKAPERKIGSTELPDRVERHLITFTAFGLVRIKPKNKSRLQKLKDRVSAIEKDNRAVLILALAGYLIVVIGLVLATLK